MQVKRFFAADMRQAMKLVRDELGPDAAILGNRRVAGGIELTAALDYQARRRRASPTRRWKWSCARPRRGSPRRAPN